MKHKLNKKNDSYGKGKNSSLSEGISVVMKHKLDKKNDSYGKGKKVLYANNSIPKTSVFSWLKITKLPSQNLTTRLFHREIHLYPKRHFNSYRLFYQNVTPNFTITNIQKPPCFIRKFSPNGRYLIAFSSDQTSVEIYEYQGPSASGELLKNCNDVGTLTDESLRNSIEKNIFNTFFRLKHTVVVASNREQLNRECSLFTDDGKYIIVGSVSNRNIANLDDNYRTNESVTPNPRSPLDDYTLHIVDIELGILRDTKTFHHDKIFLSHNQGLYLYQKTLAVLSVQHQTIYVFEITSDGTFVPVRNLGRVCHDDDEFILSSSIQPPPLRPTSSSIPPSPYPTFSTSFSSSPFSPNAASFNLNTNCLPLYEDGPFTIYSLKHRILVFLYRYAMHLSELHRTPKPLLDFYRLFNYFIYLRMWKMQLLDEAHVLIKFASEEVVTLRMVEPNGQPSLIVIYNMVSSEVVGVYENTSQELLDTFEKLSDFLRNARLSCESQFSSSPSNNIWARLSHERYKAIIVSAKGGGTQEATKRLLGQLPISAQSFSASPYLDLDLFSYDDKFVSVLERPKTCTDHPIRFYGRESGLRKFSIHAGRSTLTAGLAPSSRRLVAFTFHPSDPFAISVQRTNDEYVVSFHVRHLNQR